MKPGKTDTSQYLTQWHAGHREGIDALLERHMPWIRDQVRLRMGPVLRRRGDTGDYVQDAMVEFLIYGPRFMLSDEGQFRALILKIVQNTLRNRVDRFTAKRRAVSRERPLPSDTILCLDSPHPSVKTPSQSAAGHEQEAWVRLGMEFVDDPTREVLVLRDWDRLTFGDIGRRLGISSEAARKRYHRAFTRLADKVLMLRRGELDKILD
jgi:RNA polymerase sigma factor (sigma-70 family)